MGKEEREGRGGRGEKKAEGGKGGGKYEIGEKGGGSTEGRRERRRREGSGGDRCEVSKVDWNTVVIEKLAGTHLKMDSAKTTGGVAMM